MTPEEADQRIILSRQIYHRYKAMMDNWQWPKGDLQLMTEEIFLLNSIAEEMPEKAEKLHRLVEDWDALWRRLRAKLD